MHFGLRFNCFAATFAVAVGFMGGHGRAAVPTAEILGGLPLFFEPRVLETGGAEQYLARGLKYQILIEPSEVEFAFHTKDCSTAVPRLGRSPIPTDVSVQTRFARLKFIGALTSAPKGLGSMEGKVNYLVGKETTKWRAHVPTYATVEVRQLYPGIDLLYYGNQRQLEYDFTVAPGIDPKAIVMHFDGVDHLKLNTQGELVLSLGETEMLQHRPALYQIIAGTRREVDGGYRLLDEQTVGFSVGPYDNRFPLIIDPIFSYSTFFGGPGGETGLSVKVDAAGSVYIAGQTMSSQFPFPIPANAFQRAYRGGIVNGDAFIAKLNNTGSKLIYFTYLGGSADDTALDLALDSAGNAHVTGFTDSPDFPTRSALFGGIGGTADPTLNIYPQDAFVAELNGDGSALVYSTYLGGSGNDIGSGIAVDPVGNTYVTGYSQSTNFPVKSAFQNGLYGFINAFVAKISPNGSNLVYSTYLGGNAVDRGEGIAADASGFAYVTGYTSSSNFPTWRAQSPVINNNSGSGNVDAFVTRIAPDGLGILYSTFLGGTNNDYGYRITVDAAQNVYVTGASQSVDFPHRVIALKIGNNGTNTLNYDAFITRINSSGTRTYSILFGGTSDDEGWDVAVDSAGRAFLIGTTVSTNFPVINPFGLFRSFNSGSNDVFVTAINSDGTTVPYSAYLGGENYDFGYGIAVDAESSAYVTGLTFSKGFPVTSNPFQATLPGPTGAFVSKIRLFQPGLTSAIAGPNLRLSWPITAPDYVLQSAFSLSEANWISVPQTPVVNGSVYTVAVGTTNTASFFRLHHP